MSIKIGLPPAGRPQPSIAVLGVGGGGGNAVRSMIEGDVKGVQFMAANTDVQALEESKAELKIHLGTELTRGYGAGTDPKIGRRAADESLHEIRDGLEGLDMLFITAGMGGGTGTGASPIIARAARELGILTVGVMTSPFQFEGEARMEVARRGIKDMLEQSDTLLLISNQNLFQLENGVPHLLLAFESVNGILRDAIRGVVDLVTRPGMINTDFADLVMALRDGGLGVIGEGVASGPDRSRQAAIQAATNPLLDGVTLEGAGRLLINVTGGRDLSPDDFDEAVNYLRNLARPDAQMKVGASFDPEMEGSVRVYIAASGVDQSDAVESPRTSLRVAAEEEHSSVREIRVAEPPKEPQTRPTPEPESSPAQPSIPPVVELSAGLRRPASPAVGSAARETPPESPRRDTGGDDDWDDGIEIDIRSQSSSRTVAVSPTLSGGLQDPPVRAEKEFQPRFRQGYRRPASGLGTGPGTADRFRNSRRAGRFRHARRFRSHRAENAQPGIADTAGIGRGLLQRLHRTAQGTGSKRRSAAGGSEARRRQKRAIRRCRGEFECLSPRFRHPGGSSESSQTGSHGRRAQGSGGGGEAGSRRRPPESRPSGAAALAQGVAADDSK